MPQRWDLRNQFQVNQFAEFALARVDSGNPITVEISKPSRSLSQNAMIYKLYRDIANQREDMTFEEVKNYCKLHFGIGIMKSHDPAFADWYDEVIKSKSYEQKLFFVSHLEMTSGFNKEEASEYIDTVILEWQKLGVYFGEAPLSQLQEDLRS